MVPQNISKNTLVLKLISKTNFTTMHCTNSFAIVFTWYLKIFQTIP